MKQSLCCSLIVPPWLAAQALQEHVVPGLSSQRSSDVGRPHSKPPLEYQPSPFSCPLPSPEVFFCCFEGEHCFRSHFRKRKGDFRRKDPTMVGLQFYRRNCVGVFSLFNVTVSGPKEVLTERSGLFKSDFSPRCCFYYSGRGFLNPSSS